MVFVVLQTALDVQKPATISRPSSRASSREGTPSHSREPSPSPAHSRNPSGSDFGSVLSGVVSVSRPPSASHSRNPSSSLADVAESKPVLSEIQPAKGSLLALQSEKSEKEKEREKEQVKG